MTSQFVSIEKAIEVLKNSGMVILIDDEDRENEGDLVIAAEFITPEAINFMSLYGRGLICLSMSEAIAERLQLPMMTETNASPYGTAFTVSIEAASGVTTGISAKDRALTVKAAIHPESKPSDIISPGHVFPLKAKKNGVLERKGQTEGSVDLARLAGLQAAAVICEVINDDGTMSRRDDLIEFSKTHHIPLVTIKDLLQYRLKHESIVELAAETCIPTEQYGQFQMSVFNNVIDKAEHFALIKEPNFPNQVPLVRIHSECVTGDIFGSCKCDCGKQLERSLKLISSQGGLLIYLRQEGRGIGLTNKIKAYNLQAQGMDTVEANVHLGLPVDSRDYVIAYQILKYYGIDTVRLLTNNPQKIDTLTNYGIKVSERVPLEVEASKESFSYLKAKQEKLGHLLNLGQPSYENN